MKTIHRILSGAFLLVLVFLSLRSAQAQAPLYVVTDLGTLDGGTHSYGFGINNGGQVTGYSVLSNGTEHAALFSAGSIPQDLGTLGGTGSYGYGINNSGQVAGYSILTSGATQHAALFSAGNTPQDLGTLGGNASFGSGINNSGQVAGRSIITGNSATHAALFLVGNSPQDLGTLGGTDSIGYGINNSGQVAGNSYLTGNSGQRAALFSAGSAPQDLGTVGTASGSSSVAYGINNSGQVTGASHNTDGSAFHAALFSVGSAPQDLGSLGGTISEGFGINNSGQVTGHSYITGNSVWHAFVRTGGAMYDLNNLVSAAQGVSNIDESNIGNDINDRGQVAATGIVGGQTHAILLTPRAMGTAFSGGLGDVAFGAYGSAGRGVSNGGTVVTGSGTNANGATGYRWTLSGGAVDLNLNSSTILGISVGVSADGATIVGWKAGVGSQQLPFYQVNGGTVQTLAMLAGHNNGRADGVSDNGGAVVGWSENTATANTQRAALWVNGGAAQSLGVLSGGTFSVAQGISGDGKAAVGYSNSSNTTGGNLEAFRWTQTGGMQGLGDLPGGVFNSEGRSASRDGTVVVGQGTSASGTEAFRWVQGVGMTGLGDFSGGIFDSYAFGVSGDGSIVVGYGTDAVGPKAFVWDQKRGLRNLQSVLSSEYGVDFTGWTLQQGYGLSARGDAVTGAGRDPLGNTQAYSAQINSRTYRFVSGEAYAGFHTSKLGGLGTTVDLLDGVAGGVSGSFKTVTVDLLAVPTVQFQPGFASDVIDLTGSGTDTIVLRLGYDEATALALFGSESKVFLGWFNPNTGRWENAINGDTGGTAHFVGDRAYNSATDFALGYWGIDTANNQAWAVINHNSQFAVTPEPGSAALLLIGASLLSARRRRGTHARFLLLAALTTLLVAPAAVRAQTFYVSSFSQAIDKVDSSGAVSLFATLPANSYPQGLAFDGSGDLYAADSNTNQISRVTASGVVSLFAALPSGSFPVGLAFDATGNLYAADAGTRQISKITASGAVSLFATLPAGPSPIDIAFDSSGNLYVASVNTFDIRKVTPDGTVSTFATLPVSVAKGLAFAASGDLYAVSENQINKITPAGSVSLFATLPGNTANKGLAFDGIGNLYVANSSTYEIRKISPDGLTVSSFTTGVVNPQYIALAPVVPEPGSAALLVLGAGVLGWATTKRPRTRSSAARAGCFSAGSIRIPADGKTLSMATRVAPRISSATAAITLRPTSRSGTGASTRRTIRRGQ